MGYFVLSVVISLVVGAALYIRLRAEMERRMGEEDLSRRVREKVGLVIRQIERVADTQITMFEEKIATMEELVGRAERVRTAVDAPPRKARRNPEETPDRPAAPGRGRSGKKKAIELDFGFFGRKNSVPSGDGLSDRERAILDLHRRGESVPEIARDLATSRGEVELVLSLYEPEPEGIPSPVARDEERP